MADNVNKDTDKILNSLELYLNSLYNAAQEDIVDEIASLLEELVLEDAGATQTQRLKYAEKDGKLNKAAAVFVVVMLAANEKAIGRINKDVGKVYELNYSYMASRIKAKAGVNISGAEGKKVSKYTLRTYKSLRQRRYVTKEILQELKKGIKKGEGFKKLVRRVENVSNRSKNSAKLVARTETTRMRGMSRYEALLAGERRGLKIKKIWRHSPFVAHPRHWHQDMDGEIKDLHEPFSNGMMYPGEAGAAAKEVCNCYCFLDEEIELDA